MNGEGLRIAVIGAGVAGTFCSLELNRLLPEAGIELFDRGDPAPGAGIVMQQEFVDRISLLHPSALAVPPQHTRHWTRILLRVGDDEIASEGHGTVGFSRRALVGRLRNLAASRPGITLTVRDVAAPPDGFDLVVAADGAASRTRRALAGRLDTRESDGATRFLWLSTPATLPAMFVLHRIKAGQLIVHAYPHAEHESTLVVEAAPEVLSACGLLEAPADWIEQSLADHLSEVLQGAPVRAHTAGWQSFRTVVNRRWSAGTAVLIGDAAHTVHFSSGSGSTLAIEDGIVLAAAVADSESVREALGTFAVRRMPVVAAARRDGRESQIWFEWLSRQESRSAYQTAFALRTRRDMNTFGWFREHDPAFAAGVVRELAHGAGEPAPDTEPVGTPLTLGAIRLPTRHAAPDGAYGGPPDSGLRLGADGRVPCLMVDATAGSAVVEETTAAASVSGDACILVHGPVERAVELATELRRWTRFGAVGVVVPTTAAADALTGPDAPVVDFVAVPADPGAGRTSRTALAARVRGELGVPVLLLTMAPQDPDEVNTLIAAGRVDFVVAAPALLRTMSRLEDHALIAKEAVE